MENVGAGVYKNLANNRVLLMDRTGVELTVGKIVVRDPAKARNVEAPEELLLIKHTAANAPINSAIDKIAKLACVKRPPRLIRVETFAP